MVSRKIHTSVTFPVFLSRISTEYHYLTADLCQSLKVHFPIPSGLNVLDMCASVSSEVRLHLPPLYPAYVAEEVIRGLVSDLIDYNPSIRGQRRHAVQHPITAVTHPLDKSRPEWWRKYQPQQPLLRRCASVQPQDLDFV